MSHENSKKITIFRLPNFLEAAQSADTSSFFGQSKQSIGSYYSSQNSRELGSGLTIAEKDLLMPLIIDIYPEDREYRKAVAEFYADIDTNVPYQIGKELEIGLLENNDKPLSKTNLPISVMDYIRWRHAKGHPEVALSKEAGIGHMLKRYYIFDKDKVTNSNLKKGKEKDTAMSIYLKIKDDENIVDQMLTLLGINIREYSGPQAEENKQAKLRELSEKEETVNNVKRGGPAKFIEVYDGDHMENKFWIQRMLNTKTLFIQANKYFDAETKKVLANSLDEMVAFMLDISNTDVVNILKANVQEKDSAPYVAPLRQTIV